MRGVAKIEESELVRLSTSEEFRMGTMGARRGKRINLVARERHCRAFQRSHIYTRTCPHKGLPRQSQSACDSGRIRAGEEKIPNGLCRSATGSVLLESIVETAETKS